jgi:hypothetical protein
MSRTARTGTAAQRKQAMEDILARIKAAYGEGRTTLTRPGSDSPVI